MPRKKNKNSKTNSINSKPRRGPGRPPNKGSVASMKQNPSQAAKLANKKLKDVDIQILDVANEHNCSSKRSAEIGNLICI